MTSPLRSDEGDWVVLLASADVSGTEPHSVAFEGAEYVVWRDPDGRACVADAACPHRGASLAAGFIVDGHLTCPIHGWRFDAEGANVYRPDRQPLSSGRLRCHRVREERGQVLIELGLRGR